jgi:CheY-like chemotaxis protein
MPKGLARDQHKLIYTRSGLRTAYKRSKTGWQAVAEGNIRVLVVEDAKRLAVLIANGLRKAGFNADAVHSAKDARDQIYEGAYDAVVLDLGLPDQNDLDLLRELREAEVNRLNPNHRPGAYRNVQPGCLTGRMKCRQHSHYDDPIG